MTSATFLRDNRSLLFGIIILLNIQLTAQGQLSYADNLFKERDYFRAISAYKEAMYFSNDPDTRNHCLLHIIKAYYKSNRYKTSIKYIARYQNEPHIPADDLATARIYLGLNYYGLRLYPMAENHLSEIVESDSTGKAMFYLALLKAENDQWQASSDLYKQVHQKFPSTRVGVVAKTLSGNVQQGKNIPKKHPYLAALFSAVLPGSGQFYAQHYYDGVQALLYVSAFSFATYAAYRYDREVNNNYTTTYLAISVTSFFHLANIIGALRTTTYHNLHQREKFLTGIRETAFNIEE